MLSTKAHRHKYKFLVSIFILCAIGLRLFLIAHAWPSTDSEEGTMGLEALHIAFHGEHPIYLYGQNYMGVGEAYLGALAFQLFGVSIFALRMGMLLLFSLFLIFIYALGKLLYSERVACTTLLLMIGGTENVLIPEMKAVGGAVETIVCGSLLLLLASWLSLNTRELHATKQPLWKRKSAFCFWGLATGLGLWSHLLVVPFILCSAVLLILFCRHELRTTGLLILPGFILGALPLIVYNITAPIQDNTIAVFLNLHNITYPNAPTGIILLLKQLSGTFLYTLPIATGFPQIISNTVLPFYSPLQPRFLPSILLYGLWSLGYIALLIGSTWQSLKQLYLHWHMHQLTKIMGSDTRRKLALYTARLMMLTSGWLTIISYAASATAAQRPWSFRYLVGLMIIMPALLAPLVSRQDWIHFVKFSRIEFLRVSLLVLILTISIVGTSQSLATFPSGNVFLQQQEVLFKGLLQRGITRIYSGYWVCDRIIFSSQENIICAVVNEKMQPGLTRYLPYKSIVDQSNKVAYVFTENMDFHPSDMIRMFANNSHYSRIYIGQYIVFIATQKLKAG